MFTCHLFWKDNAFFKEERELENKKKRVQTRLPKVFQSSVFTTNPAWLILGELGSNLEVIFKKYI